MQNFLLSLLFVAILSIVFLWMKLKRASSLESSLKAEQDQREADEKDRTEQELKRRNEERLRKAKDAQEAIDNFRNAVDEFKLN